MIQTTSSLPSIIVIVIAVSSLSNDCTSATNIKYDHCQTVDNSEHLENKCRDNSGSSQLLRTNATINATANTKNGKFITIDRNSELHLVLPNSKNLAYQLRDDDGSLRLPGDNSINSDSSDQDMTTLSKFMFAPISRSHNMRAYTLDISSYRKSARNVGDPAFLDNNNTDHINRCENHLNYYASLLDQVRTTNLERKISKQALVLADTYGRPESGVHTGNSFWLGSHSQCLATKILMKMPDVAAHQSINSQYCILTAHAPSWNKKDTLNTVRLGICLPETCTNSMLEDYFSQKVYQMATIHLYAPYNELEMTQIFCLPHSTSEVRQFSEPATVAFLLVIGLFVSACLVATIIDNNSLKELGRSVPSNNDVSSFKRTSRNWKIVTIEAFSITRNFNKIFYVKETNGSHFLDSLAGIKCLGLFWIVGAHSVLLGPTTANNLLLMDTLNKTLLSYFYLTAHLVVDTFFAASGILAAYLMFKTKTTLMSVPEFIVATLHRYWRLTPLYLLAYWYAKSVGHLVSSGPFWDYMTSENSPRLQCSQESWLVALLHWSDFKGPKEHCVPFAWFIANGIKFWLVTPIFIALISKSRLRGYIITGMAILANVVLVYTLALKSTGVDLDALFKFSPESTSNMINSMGEVYSRPYSRIAAYLIGLIAGHLLFQMETKQIQMQLSEKANKIIWTLVTATFIMLTFMLKFVPPMPKDHQIYIFSLSSALIRPMWATCSCWLIFAIAQGQAVWLKKFLSMRVWQILVRLSYSAYVIQGEVLAIYMMAHNGSHSVRYTDMIAHAINTIVLTLIVSFFTAILIEYPLIALEELVLPKSPKHQANQQEQHHHQDSTNQQEQQDTQNNKLNGLANGTSSSPLKQKSS